MHEGASRASLERSPRMLLHDIKPVNVLLPESFATPEVILLRKLQVSKYGNSAVGPAASVFIQRISEIDSRARLYRSSFPWGRVSLTTRALLTLSYANFEFAVPRLSFRLPVRVGCCPIPPPDSR